MFFYFFCLPVLFLLFFACDVVRATNVDRSTQRRFLYTAKYLFLLAGCVCVSISVGKAIAWKLYRVLTWWFSGVPGRTDETFLGRPFDKNRARTTTTQSPTVSQMPLGDELRECDTKTSRTFSSNSRRRVFWGSFTSGRDGWESPTPEGGRLTYNSWHLGEKTRRLFGTYVFIFLFAFNLQKKV